MQSPIPFAPIRFHFFGMGEFPGFASGGIALLLGNLLVMGTFPSALVGADLGQLGMRSPICSTAFATCAAPRNVDQIVATQRMATFTVCFGGVEGSCAVGNQTSFPAMPSSMKRDWFSDEVVWIHAPFVATGVMNIMPCGNGPMCKKIGNAVGGHDLTMQTRLPISLIETRSPSQARAITNRMRPKASGVHMLQTTTIKRVW